MRSTAIASILVIGLAHIVYAQDPAEAALARRLKAGERVWVEISTSDVRTGRVLGVGDGVLKLRADGREEDIPVSRIWRVQRKQNGIVLGTLIGAGVGFAFGLPVASLVANEGGGSAYPLLFMTGVGAAAGAGLDALLWRKRTVYAFEEMTTTVRPILTPDRVGIFFSKRF
jgi:hypothetical protein